MQCRLELSTGNVISQIDNLVFDFSLCWRRCLQHCSLFIPSNRPGVFFSCTKLTCFHLRTFVSADIVLRVVDCWWWLNHVSLVWEGKPGISWLWTWPVVDEAQATLGGGSAKKRNYSYPTSAANTFLTGHTSKSPGLNDDGRVRAQSAQQGLCFGRSLCCDLLVLHFGYEDCRRSLASCWLSEWKRIWSVHVFSSGWQRVWVGFYWAIKVFLLSFA